MKNKIINKWKEDKGYVDGESIFAIVFMLFIIIIIAFGIYKFVYSRTVGNKTAIDMNYTFKRAITYIGNERMELDIEKWKDYDGEQIQVVTKDGKVYLLSMNNTILIKE